MANNETQTKKPQKTPKSQKVDSEEQSLKEKRAQREKEIQKQQQSRREVTGLILLFVAFYLEYKSDNASKNLTDNCGDCRTRYSHGR